ncbi:hypothetical protein EG68_09546 [Paragonimus skrjabini miyazakii]|uniref:Uncharacterized protein n=1 Tax=Paragonimus skrjabini miyazakii TaxID=59628 RepID=A0A8S9YM22_9TREM|nr:hypothetical protein EG68_09546 [Paragonimus skrjabini miyazakii]
MTVSPTMKAFEKDVKQLSYEEQGDTILSSVVITTQFKRIEQPIETKTFFLRRVEHTAEYLVSLTDRLQIHWHNASLKTTSTPEYTATFTPGQGSKRQPGFHKQTSESTLCCGSYPHCVGPNDSEPKIHVEKWKKANYIFITEVCSVLYPFHCVSWIHYQIQHAERISVPTERKYGIHEGNYRKTSNPSGS